MRWGPALLGTLGTRRRQGGKRRSRSKGWPRPGLVHDSAAAASWRCIAAQHLPPWLEPGCWGAEAAADGSADDRGWSDDELLARLDEVLLPGETYMNETIKCAAREACACRLAAQPCRPGWRRAKERRRAACPARPRLRRRGAARRAGPARGRPGRGAGVGARAEPGRAAAHRVPAPPPAPPLARLPGRGARAPRVFLKHALAAAAARRRRCPRGCERARAAPPDRQRAAAAAPQFPGGGRSLAAVAAALPPTHSQTCCALHAGPALRAVTVGRQRRSARSRRARWTRRPRPRCTACCSAAAARLSAWATASSWCSGTRTCWSTPAGRAGA